MKSSTTISTSLSFSGLGTRPSLAGFRATSDAVVSRSLRPREGRGKRAGGHKRRWEDAVAWDETACDRSRYERLSGAPGVDADGSRYHASVIQ